MTRRASRWAIVAVCFMTAVAVTYLTVKLSWTESPRLAWAIVPGAYLGAALNRVLHIPTTGSGIWYLFFISQILVWLVAALVVAWAVAALRANWKARRHHGSGGVA